MKSYLQKQVAKSLFVRFRKRKASVNTLRMSVTVRQSSSFHILTSFPQVDADISLLLLGNDVASAEALVADKVTLKSCSIDECLFNNVSRHYTYRPHPFNFVPR